MILKPKFDLARCGEYISSIEDFEIEFERRPSLDYRGNAHMYQVQREHVKAFLRIFLLECMQESSLREVYDFLQWLSERRLFWESQQFIIIGRLAYSAERLAGREKIEIEKKKLRYTLFFKHHYKVIELIQEDVLSALDLPGFYLPAADSHHDVQPGTTGGFDALFRNGISPEPYYRMLRDHEYPLIGNQYNYISKALKGGFCIWIYELQQQCIICHQTDKVYAALLLKKITGLKTFSESMFRKTNNTAEVRYRAYFRKRIAAIKAKDDRDLRNGS